VLEATNSGYIKVHKSNGQAVAIECRISILDQLGGILSQYSSPNPPQENATAHFQEVATQVPRPQLGGLLSNLFGSPETGSFGDNISQMFSQSDPQQKAGILNRLLQAAGGAGALSSLGLNLPGLGSGADTSISPAQAQQVSPATVKDVANHAQQQNPGIVEQAGDFYSHHPQLVQALGTGAAIWAMQRMLKR